VLSQKGVVRIERGVFCKTTQDGFEAGPQVLEASLEGQDHAHARLAGLGDPLKRILRGEAHFPGDDQRSSGLKRDSAKLFSAEMNPPEWFEGKRLIPAQKVAHNGQFFNSHNIIKAKKSPAKGGAFLPCGSGAVIESGPDRTLS